ncbi:hypothetical protein PVK06_009376 [Gossypium arboreum]|uniref:Uncharacterized protein n=1 Tax=Gossypium arboreum TaxID=29729 RepID=A0ABR0QM94_GOSAR|nr:hypothetical protein PVK06_009376 [Gossypium arboreum]
MTLCFDYNILAQRSGLKMNSDAFRFLQSLVLDSCLVQSFPRRYTEKLDERNVMQCQQHILLIIEGYELIRFLEGTLPTPPRFVSSPDGTLASAPDAFLFVQQDKLLALWLLSTISAPLLSSFIAAKTPCEVWSTVNHLFTVATRAKLSRIKHELHSIKKSMMTVKEYIIKIKNTCTLLEASGLVVSKAEKKIVDVLLKFKNRQTHAVNDIPFHAHLVEATSATSVEDSVHGSHPPPGAHGHDFRLGFSSRSMVAMDIWHNAVIIISTANTVVYLF